MKELILAIVIAALGSNGLFAVVQLLIKRHDDKKSSKNGTAQAVARIEKRLEVQERDLCRTQMLLLMSNYPAEKSEIMKLGEHYFGTLHGDWYMTGMFNRWLEINEMGKPEWFNPQD